MKTSSFYFVNTKLILLLLAASFTPLISCSQWTPDPVFNWSQSGLLQSIPPPSQSIHLTFLDAGGQNSVSTDVQNIIDNFNGNGQLELIFPEGTFKFTEPIILKSNISIRGLGASQTTLVFELSNPESDCISASGSLDDSSFIASFDIQKGSQILSLPETTIKPGDWIKLTYDDQDFMYSDWAYNSHGQINKIIAESESGFSLKDVWRLNISTLKNPKIQIMNPIQNIEISCLTIDRKQASNGQTKNINFTNAVNCLVKGVESKMCNFAHVCFTSSAYSKVENSYFHHAFGYDGGGKGYGVVFQLTTGNCVAENNVFEHLRHSMLVQAGANTNVYSHNYSFDPFREVPFGPTDYIGDIALHGNWVYGNLFEGNIIANLFIDGSHGKNGWFNTFFRNRTTLYGITNNSSTPTDSCIFIGNEITNNGVWQMSGTGHFSWCNRYNNAMLPAGSSGLNQESLFYVNGKPDFAESKSWPVIGYPLPSSQNQIPAMDRAESTDKTICNLLSSDNTISFSSHKMEVYPIPAKSELFIETNSNETQTVSVLDFTGKVLKTIEVIGKTTIDISKLENGTYVIQNRKLQTNRWFVVGD